MGYGTHGKGLPALSIDGEGAPMSDLRITQLEAGLWELAKVLTRIRYDWSEPRGDLSHGRDIIIGLIGIEKVRAAQTEAWDEMEEL